MRSIIFIILAMIVAFAVKDARADSNALALISTFESVCLDSNGSLDFITKWVDKNQLREITGADARKVYAGSAGNIGHAWFMQVESSYVIVAIRAITNACAVFSSEAKSTEIQEYVDGLPRKFSKKWPNATTVKDDKQQGSLGMRRGRVIALGTPGEPVVVLITAITNEQKGGPYQATLQAHFSSTPLDERLGDRQLPK